MSNGIVQSRPMRRVKAFANTVAPIPLLALPEWILCAEISKATSDFSALKGRSRWPTSFLN